MTKTGFISSKARVVRAGETISVLLNSARHLTGVVRSGATGRAVETAFLTWMPTDQARPSRVRRTRTSKDGTFELEVPVDVSGLVRTHATGFEEQRTPVLRDSAEYLEIGLDPGDGRVRGVTFWAGQPIQGARVSMGENFVLSGPRGEFVLAGVPSRGAQIVGEVLGACCRLAKRANPGEDVELYFASASLDLTITVGGTPGPGIEVLLLSDQLLLSRLLVTDDGGRVHADDLVPGVINLRVRPPAGMASTLPPLRLERGLNELRRELERPLGELAVSVQGASPNDFREISVYAVETGSVYSIKGSQIEPLQFVFRELPAGEYRVTESQRGLQASRVVEVVARQLSTITLEFEDLGSIRGTLLQDGAKEVGRLLHLSSSERTPSKFGLTGPDGSFTFSSLEPGHYQLSTGYKTIDLDVGDGPVTLVLEENTAHLQCLVSDEAGGPISDALVRLSPGSAFADSARLRRESLTSVSGVAFFRSVPEGTARLAVNASGFVNREVVITTHGAAACVVSLARVPS